MQGLHHKPHQLSPNLGFIFILTRISMSQQQKDGAKDLEILRREYRNMEVNRKAFNEESNAIA